MEYRLFLAIDMSLYRYKKIFLEGVQNFCEYSYYVNLLYLATNFMGHRGHSSHRDGCGGVPPPHRPPLRTASGDKKVSGSDQSFGHYLTA